MLGPTSNPFMIVFVNVLFFVVVGYTAYFFGKSSHRS
jgi:hypothetical protein